MSLQREFLHHADLAKAAEEALANVDKLRVGGFFQEAFEVCATLARPGPWECPKAGLNYQKICDLLPMLAWLNGAICPALPGQPMRKPAQLAQWARQEQRQHLAHLVIADRLQRAPAGAGWTRDALESLKAPPDAKEGMAFALFLTDLHWILKDRLRKQLQLQPVELMPPEVLRFTPVRTAADIQVAPEAEASDHGYLMDLLHRQLQHFEGGYLGEQCFVLSVALDLAAGHRAEAVARLKQFSNSQVGKLAIDYPIRLWEPYVDILRSGELAPSIGLDAAGVDAWMVEFRSRSLHTLAATEQPADFDWTSALHRFRDNVLLELGDPEEAENAAGMLSYHAPVSAQLIAVAERRECFVPPVDEAALANLEARLGTGLPPSYRRFLATTDGLFAGNRISLLPAADVDWFRRRDPHAVSVWMQNTDDEADDEQYATYGPDQDCIHMRPRHLASALQVSTSLDGDVLLLVSDVRFGEEWEAWFLGAKNPGAFRYRSFAEMIQETLFKWVED